MLQEQTGTRWSVTHFTDHVLKNLSKNLKLAGKAQIKEQIAYYQKNARTIYEGLKNAGYTVSGAVNSPYVWLKTPDNMTSWEFFDFLLEKANVVGTPGSGFGPSGEGYFRLTAFGSYENTLEAIKRIENI